jgi:hypothetical protein
MRLARWMRAVGPGILPALLVACPDESPIGAGGDPRVDVPDASADTGPPDTGLGQWPQLDLDARTQPPNPNPVPPPMPDGRPWEQPPGPEPCDPDAGADRPPDTNDDIYGIDECRPRPQRLIILGDSIASAFQPGSLLETRLRARAPNLYMENYAFGGSKIQDLPNQARFAGGGSGHVFVWIWSIANNLVSDGLLLDNTDLAPFQAAFADVFAYFTDPARFPGGATFMLNTQYGPFDECEAPEASTWQGPGTKERFLYLNETFFMDVAEARSDTVAIDHYPDFLGHGTNANIKGCPYCGRDNSTWFAFGFHLNDTGKAHVADKWAVAFDQMLSASCPR